MLKHRRRQHSEEAELDITSFMNLMIVLVPVLLLSLVFSQVRILNLQLPLLTEASADSDEPKLLELVVTPTTLQLNYPSGVPLKQFSRDDGHDFAALSGYLRDLKMTFQQQQIDKSDIVLLLAPDIDYQTIVTTMDTVRSYDAVVAANVVPAELFPQISFGDAPSVLPQLATSDDGGNL
ncbi:biopolymer transporter ExbD [Ferrimonas senticii]|uniref:biopolymer transporter ExbD n=1 Tax=Ferrimonas senticii TaxID=394566 RepID=UPI0004253742|nr:biopolymer transporter ExbD [Ferrimonas senticii]